MCYDLVYLLLFNEILKNNNNNNQCPMHICHISKCQVYLTSCTCILKSHVTTAHLCYNGYSTSMNAYELWGVRAEIQIFRKEFHTHIHLDYVNIEILSCIKKKKKKKSHVHKIFQKFYLSVFRLLYIPIL